MSRVDRTVELGLANVPFVAFPETPRTILIANHPVHAYIPPEDMDKFLISMFESTVVPDDAQILVNMNGGRNIFDRYRDYRQKRGRPIDPNNVHKIEFHRGPGNSVVVVRGVPESIQGGNVLSLDDINDRGQTGLAVYKECARRGASVQTMMAIYKEGIEGRVNIPNARHAVCVDNRWLGGTGMNFGTKDVTPEIDAQIRDYGGVVAKID